MGIREGDQHQYSHLQLLLHKRVSPEEEEEEEYLELIINTKLTSRSDQGHKRYNKWSSEELKGIPWPMQLSEWWDKVDFYYLLPIEWLSTYYCAIKVAIRSSWRVSLPVTLPGHSHLSTQPPNTLPLSQSVSQSPVIESANVTRVDDNNIRTYRVWVCVCGW